MSALLSARGPDSERAVDETLVLLERRGRRRYVNGRLTLWEHASQAARMAEEDGAPAALVVAALLHDVGHVLRRGPCDLADMAVDTRHEELGGLWLARCFGPDVAEPVRLHVTAKRYLCAVEDGYWEQLSPAAVRNLALQGGPLGAAQTHAFERHPRHREAVWLRRIDDRALRPGVPVPPHTHYRDLVQAVAASAREIALDPPHSAR